MQESFFPAVVATVKFDGQDQAEESVADLESFTLLRIQKRFGF